MLEEFYGFFDNIKKYSEIEEKVSSLVGFLCHKKIVIYGAGSLGQLLKKRLNEFDIEVLFFVDRSFDKIKFVEDTPVKSIDYLKSVSSDENLLVLIGVNTLSLIKVIEAQLKDITQNVCYGFELARILTYKKCKKSLEHSADFDLVECAKCGAEERGCFFYDEYIKIKSVKNQNGHYTSMSFDWLGYIIGQFCTLKCKHCCEGVPYMKNPQFTEKEVIFSDLRKIARASSFIKYVELIGGEPLMHPEIIDILKGLLKVPNIGYIKIFTNGTVIPNDELCEVLKNKRIEIHLSNYYDVVDEMMKKKITQMREKLELNKINYIFIESTNWLDFMAYDYREVENDTLNNYFSNCFLADCHRLHNGILYRCPHQYAGIISDHLERVEGEMIDIHSLNDDDLGRALDKFESLPYTQACRYCTMPYNATEIITGEQLVK